MGKAIGVTAQNVWKVPSPSDFTEQILDAVYSGKFDELKLSENYLSNEYGPTILTLLRSKDDSLLLLIVSLLYTFTVNSVVDPAILFESNLYPIGQRRKALLMAQAQETMEAREETKSPSRRSISEFSAEERKTSAKDMQGKYMSVMTQF